MKSLMCPMLLVAFLMFGADTGLACTCAPAQSPARELERSTAVFSGKVTKIKRRKQAADIFADVEVVFRVSKAWKGVKSRTVSVFTSTQSATCGYGFRQNRTYLVYANGDAGGRLSTGICSLTKRLKDAGRDLNELGRGRSIAAGAPKGAGLMTHRRRPTTARTKG